MVWVGLYSSPTRCSSRARCAQKAKHCAPCTRATRTHSLESLQVTSSWLQLAFVIVSVAENITVMFVAGIRRNLDVSIGSAVQKELQSALEDMHGFLSREPVHLVRIIEHCAPALFEADRVSSKITSVSFVDPWSIIVLH